MKPIAHIRTDLPQKFGIPRNSFLAPHLRGCIVFEPECALESAVAGIEGFSHLWLIWQFENGVPGGTAEDIAADSRGTLQEQGKRQMVADRATPATGRHRAGRRVRIAQPLSPEPAGLKLREARSGGAHRRRARAPRPRGRFARRHADSRHQALYPLRRLPSRCPRRMDRRRAVARAYGRPP